MQYMYVASPRCLPQIASTKYRQCVLYIFKLLFCFFADINFGRQNSFTFHNCFIFKKKEGTKRLFFLKKKLSYDGFTYTLSQSLAISQVLTKAFVQVKNGHTALLGIAYIRKSNIVLDSGFHAVDSGFQVLDSSIFQQNVDS